MQLVDGCIEVQKAKFGRRYSGAVVGDPIAANADRIDDHPPELHPYDAYGDRSNHVEYHPAQHENEALIYERGIVADAFRAPPDRAAPVGLIHTLTMQLLLAYADTGLVCSQSMTSGAALVLRNHDQDGHYDRYLEALTTRDPEAMIEGAMFLTEEQGGNDVGANQTVATPATDVEEADRVSPGDDGVARTYELSGEKWFCSNIDAQATLALARRPDAPSGTDGLSLFLVPHRLPSGALNPQHYRRLKEKLGTLSVPTGEVEFDGTIGYLVGEPEAGFKYMTTMLNWERVTNAVGAVGIIGRLLLESKIQAATREAFGRPLQDHPLMQRDLVELAVDHEATLAFAMEAGRWFDRYERDHEDTTAFRLLRILVPVAKHVTTRTAVETASYAMEIQGGNGYVDDFVTHRLYRDVQALPIWEGTANILALDVLRSMDREAAHEALIPLIEGYLEDLDHPYLDGLAAVVHSEFDQLQGAMAALAAEEPGYAQHEAKVLTEYIYDVLTAALLLNRAAADLADGDGRTAVVADLFVSDAFLDRDARGITTGEAVPMQVFDAIVTYATLPPADLPDPPSV